MDDPTELASVAAADIHSAGRRKPRVEYKWRAVTRAVEMQARGIAMNGNTLAGRRVVGHVCDWSLYGANNEFVCGSHPQGYRDKAAARKAVSAVARLLQGADIAWDIPALMTFREVGPGPRPKEDAK